MIGKKDRRESSSLNRKELYKLAQAHLDWDARRLGYVGEIHGSPDRCEERELEGNRVAEGSKRKLPAHSEVFQHFRPNKFAYLGFILAMLPDKEKLSLVMDRTNWEFGSVHIKIL